MLIPFSSCRWLLSYDRVSGKGRLARLLGYILNMVVSDIEISPPRRWLNPQEVEQAERDMASVRVLQESGHYEWACLISQQAGEKAARAVLHRWGAEVRGHSVLQLLSVIADRQEVPQPVLTAASVLDRYYIPSRYPNGYPSGKPADYMGEEDATNASRSAEEVLRHCHGLLAG